MRKIILRIISVTLLVGTFACANNKKLHIPAGEGNLEEVKHQIEVNKVNVNSRNIAKQTPLMYASKENIVQYLISKGADVNAQSSNGTTALMYAIVDADKTDVAKILIANGADVNLENDYDETALFYAYAYGGLNGNQVGVDLLLENNIDPSIENDDGKTAEETIITVFNGTTTILPPRISNIKQIKPENGVLQFIITPTHQEDVDGKIAYDRVSTKYYIKNILTEKWYKFNRKTGKVSLPEGKYQFIGMDATLNNKKQKLKNIKSSADAEKIYLSYLPQEDFENTMFEVRESKTTCINIESETRKIDGSNFLITAVVFGFANFKVETGCSNSEDLLVPETLNNHMLVQYGFDSSVNFDYLKLGKNTNSNIFYLGSIPSLDFVHQLGSDDQDRIIPHLNNDLADNLVDYMDENHLISQKKLFSDYLLKSPNNHIK